MHKPLVRQPDVCYRTASPHDIWPWGAYSVGCRASNPRVSIRPPTWTSQEDYGKVCRMLQTTSDNLISKSKQKAKPGAVPNILWFPPSTAQTGRHPPPHPPNTPTPSFHTPLTDVSIALKRSCGHASTKRLHSSKQATSKPRKVSW